MENPMVFEVADDTLILLVDGEQAELVVARQHRQHRERQAKAQAEKESKQ